MPLALAMVFGRFPGPVPVGEDVAKFASFLVVVVVLVVGVLDAIAVVVVVVAP